MSIDLSLDRIRKLLTFLPPYTRPTCHIAGTNGKGSVSALITSILRASSPPYRVGRFNSPHLVSIYDCITIDDGQVTPDTYTDARSRVEKADKEHNVGASSFELLTLTALQIFEDAKVDIAVIEVGMGGRLDATNIIPDDCILVSALTAVDLDHQAFLGNTVTSIAREKVGIAREGKPFVLGPQTHSQVEQVAREHVSSIGGEVFRAIVPVGQDWNEIFDGPVPSIMRLLPKNITPPPQPVEVLLPCFEKPIRALLPLQGTHQLANLGTALAVISALLTYPSCSSHSSLKLTERITPDTICRGISSVVWSGRLSFHKVTVPLQSRSSQSAEIPGPQATEELLVLVDGAHNPASSATLASYISELVSRVLTPDNIPVSGSPQTTASPSSSDLVQKRTLTLTYLLALSHSPPKTPLQTLTPLFSHESLPTIPDVQLDINVGVLRFTPPEGMPWVKSVPPSELRGVMKSLLPMVDVWSPLDDEDPKGQLSAALNWAAARHNLSDDRVREGLVVIAGSLYLVADFYRLLNERSTSFDIAS